MKTIPFGAFHIMQVDPGSKVTDERTGQEIIVDDDTCAVKGRVIFCTKRAYDLMILATEKPTSPSTH